MWRIKSEPKQLPDVLDCDRVWEHFSSRPYSWCELGIITAVKLHQGVSLGPPHERRYGSDQRVGGRRSSDWRAVALVRRAVRQFPWEPRAGTDESKHSVGLWNPGHLSLDHMRGMLKLLPPLPSWESLPSLWFHLFCGRRASTPGPSPWQRAAWRTEVLCVWSTSQNSLT